MEAAEATGEKTVRILASNSVAYGTGLSLRNNRGFPQNYGRANAQKCGVTTGRNSGGKSCTEEVCGRWNMENEESRVLLSERGLRESATAALGRNATEHQVSTQACVQDGQAGLRSPSS